MDPYVFLDDHSDDAGVLTPEFATLIFVATALAGVLLVIITSPPVREALSAMIQDALDGS